MSDERRESPRREDDQAMEAFRTSAKEGYLYIDREGRILSWNDQAAALLPLKPVPLDRSHIRDVLPPEPWTETLVKAITARERHELVVPGQQGPLMVTHTPLASEGGQASGSLITAWYLEHAPESQAVFHLSRQYGELKRSHEELKRAYEVATGGSTSAATRPGRQLALGLQDLAKQLGVLHELLHEQREGADPAFQPTLGKMVQAVLQGRELLAKLGPFLPLPPVAKSPQPLKKILDQVVGGLEERLAHRAIRVEKRFEASLPAVAADLPALVEALTQLAVAFSDRFAAGSALTLQADHVPQNQETVLTLSGSVPQALSPFLLEQLPALGLFATHQMLEAHQAVLHVTTQGDRTTLRLHLPAATAPREDPASPVSILIIEPQQDVWGPLVRFLKQAGYQVVTAPDGRSGLKRVEEDPPDVVLIAEPCLEREGLELLSEFKNADQLLPVGILCGYEPTNFSQRLLDAGAFQRILRPYRKEDLIALVQKGLELRRMKQEMDLLRQQVTAPSAEGGLTLGESPQIRQALEYIHQVAPTDMTVIIQGESGSGKEVVARLMHRHSRRSTKSFIAIDCGALPENLVESELFGYERGAFTGAERRKLGHFELAQGGTIFLDEIGNLSVGVQAKLLRVIQERSIQRLGGRREVPVDVRVITASNVDLASAVKAGQFREDLYHRLNEFTIYVPPLRDRPTDLPVLSEVFRQEANHELGKHVTGFAPEVFELLKSYPWPGNVRELKNTIKRAVLLADTIVLPEHLEVTLRVRQPLQTPSTAPSARPGDPAPASAKLPTAFTGGTGMGSPSELKRASKQASSEIEKQLILDALQKTRYNKTEAAKLLGIDRTALYYKMKKFGINL